MPIWGFEEFIIKSLVMSATPVIPPSTSAYYVLSPVPYYGLLPAFVSLLFDLCPFGWQLRIWNGVIGREIKKKHMILLFTYLFFIFCEFRDRMTV